MSLSDVYKLWISSLCPNQTLQIEFQSTTSDQENQPPNYYPFPSVTKGPISIANAKNLLNFEPTSTERAFSQMVAFYREAFFKYPKMKASIEKQLKKEMLHNDSLKVKNFNEFLSQYKLN